MQEETDKCRECGMPLENQEDCCSCEPTLCFHCCKCADGCVCGCKNRLKKSDEKAEF
ncbi:MAG: hypothetical protein WCX69_00385 [Candidatus Paceibacterota bacterium]